jgi:DNA excision repair protein ERCC-2
MPPSDPPVVTAVEPSRDGAALTATAGWTWTVAVRSLCEFTAKAGDLDRRFTPTATALEGLQSQQGIASRRGEDYQTEIALEGRQGPLRVRGRADGYDPQRRCLEEIKAIRGHPDEIPANRRRLHWAQLQTYGALFCRRHRLAELSLALVYVDVATQAEVELLELCSAESLEQAFVERCEAFVHWARQEAMHRAARDRALEQLAFPMTSFRSGQRSLAEAVYRAATQGRSLLAQAPTGIGKTVGTLFPMLRAMPAQGIDKVAYLTCKGTGHRPALEALAALRDSTPGRALRVSSLVPKEQGCQHPDKACHGDACPLARGFYDRLDAARAEAVEVGWLDADAQRDVALRHGICPYYLGQELIRWADVLVGDVHHLFDPNGQLWGLAQALDWKLGVLVDEAHNLVERTRQMHSAELSIDDIRAAGDDAPPMLQPLLAALREAAWREADRQTEAVAVLDELPDALDDAMRAAGSALSEHFHRQPLATGGLLGFHFALQRFLRLAETFGEHSLLVVQRPAARMVAGVEVDPTAGAEAGAEAGAGTTAGTDAGPTASDVRFSLHNVVPARFLRPRLEALHSTVLFSATLAPPDYAIELLGLPAGTVWIDVPPAFAAEHLTVQVASRVSTRLAHRPRSLGRLVDVIEGQFDAHPGNYLAFFSSFDYLDQVAEALARRRPDLPQWRQARRMDPAARQAFLDRFTPDGRGIGFAVLGGVFAEGVDLPGTRLIGAFIATLGLPPVSPLQDHLRLRLDRLFGEDCGYADRVPAMQRVVQAAGRVLRTPEDRGWLWLLDDRYARADIVRLLPPWWGLGAPG